MNPAQDKVVSREAKQPSIAILDTTQAYFLEHRTGGTDLRGGRRSRQ